MLTIFDCDGVLVDSELLANQVLADYLTELGFPYTREECTKNFVGKSMLSIVRMVEEGAHQKLPEIFCKELLRRDKSAFEGRLQALPGVADAIVSWTGPKCVASSSSFERIYNSLRITKLISYFEPNIFSASQVASGKPAPDLFLFASKAMDVLATECLVIEDSVPGVIAGKTAGMRVAGFTGGSHCGPEHEGKLFEAGADQVFDNMMDLRNSL